MELYLYHPLIRSWLSDTLSSSERIVSNDRVIDVERSGAVCFEILEALRKTTKTELKIAETDVKLVPAAQTGPC